MLQGIPQHLVLCFPLLQTQGLLVRFLLLLSPFFFLGFGKEPSSHQFIGSLALCLPLGRRGQLP